MANCKYPGFNKLEENSLLFLSLPLCDLLRELIGKRDYAYISSALYPLELTELILHYLKYDRGIDDGGEFAQKYLTEDSLCPRGRSRQKNATILNTPRHGICL